jgi:pimeloyl-ACP methyl ester carboxylesterase
LHGLGRSPSDWSGIADGLARIGEVRAPALSRSPAAALRCARAVLEPGAILIGHSLGGVLALRLASEPSTQLRAVVLTGCFFPPARNGRSTAASMRDYASHRIAYARALSRRRSGDREALGPGSRTDSAGALFSLIGLALRRGRFYAELIAVRPPVLVVHARDDHHVPLDFALAAVAQRPATGLRVLGEGGHHAHVERPRQWLDAVVPWLGQETTAP